VLFKIDGGAEGERRPVRQIGNRTEGAHPFRGTLLKGIVGKRLTYRRPNEDHTQEAGG
jgi:hypothetical protein